MNANEMTIREPFERERNEVLDIHMNAFGDDEGPVIAKLVNELLDDVTARPIHSLVAEIDGRLLGHVLFTAVTVEPDNAKTKSQILAPLAVVANRQRQGIGKRLVREGLRRLSDDKVKLVFVLGYPDYYSRFGFTPAGIRGLQAPYPIPDQHADAWMVHELVPGAIDSANGTVQCCKSLDHRQYWIE